MKALGNSGTSRPPQYALRLARWLLRKEFCEEIEGDMEEEYHWDLEHYSLRKANRRYWWNVMQLLRPNLIRDINGQKQMNTLDTLTNYTKVTVRNMLRHRMYAFIKIGGFAIGIALVILIGLYVIGEGQIDRQFADKPVFRMLYESRNPERPYISTSVPPPLAIAIKHDYPEVNESGRLLSFDGFGDAGGNLFRPANSEISIFEERFAYADASIPEMLGFDMLHGKRSDALSQPKSIIISERKARKYYQEMNPVGQVVYLDDEQDKAYTISGVFKSLEDTHLKDFDFFLTLKGQEFWKGEQTDWCCYNYSLYVELQDEFAYDALQPKLKAAHDRYFLTYAKDTEDPAAQIIADFKTLKLQHVRDTYLHSKGISDFIVMNDASTIRIFVAVAFFILLLACVNFINLATANSTQRAKEIGLRKAIGSRKSDIIKQFLVEALVLSTISVTVGVLQAWFASPLFSSVAGVSIEIPWGNPFFYAFVICFTLGIGLLSGLYPAFYLAGFKPIAVLGGNLVIRGRTANGLIRNGLVVFQFAISLILSVSALVVYRQMNFILTKDAGFDKDQMVMIQGFRSLGDQRKAFKEEVKALPFVKNSCYSSFMPVTGTRRNGNEFWLAGRMKLDKGVAGQMWYIDDDFFNTFEIELLEGRIFSNDLASDSAAVVINEAMVHEMRLEDPLNSKLETYRKWNIVGVIKDFHFNDFRKKVKPWVAARAGGGELLAVKIEGANMEEAMPRIEELWGRFKPNQPMRYDFLDVRFEIMHEDVKRTRTLFFVFAIFGIVVACLGLFGLSVFTISQRSKELSIRKVLGASAKRLFALLTRNYLTLVTYSFLFALPISFYLMQHWLEGFEYRILAYYDAMIIGAIALLLIALVAIGSQSLKAALSNPAEGLRDE